MHNDLCDVLSRCITEINAHICSNMVICQMINMFVHDDLLIDSRSWSPSMRYELMRRKTETDVFCLWNFVQNKLMNTKQACESEDSNLVSSHVQSILQLGTDIQR